MMLVIKDFNIDFLKNKKKYYRNENGKAKRSNTEDFISWINNTLKEFCPNLPPGYSYNSLALYLNSESLLKIKKHVLSFSFFNFCPIEDNNLKDNELGIDLNKLIDKKLF